MVELTQSTLMPTIKQKKAFIEIVEKGRTSVSAVMRDVGYTDKTAIDPSKLTQSKGWKELLEEALPDELLALKHVEGLNATKPHTSLTEPDRTVIDYAVRGKYLEMAYKLKGRLQDRTEMDGKIEVVITRGEVTAIDGEIVK